MASSHPVITSYFNASNSASWLSTSFLLTSAVFNPLVSRLSDNTGRKPPYLVCIFIFAVATIWCAVAQSMLSFILARAACGIGAGGMMALGAIMIADSMPIEVRGPYQSGLNIMFGIGASFGAGFGGAMADHLGWRWEFGVQVLPILICLVGATFAMPAELGLYGKKREPFFVAMRDFDFMGSILLAMLTTFLILGLNLGGNIFPWTHPIILASLAIVLVCLPAFLYCESKAINPIMPLRILRTSPRANLVLGSLIASFILNAILFNIPLFFQAVLLTSATESGLRLIVPSAVASSVGAVTGFAIHWTRRVKWPVLSGATLFLVGSIFLSCLGRDWPTWVYLVALVPSSIAQGLQMPGTTLAMFSCSEQKESGTVSAAIGLSRNYGQVMGVAISSLVLQNSLLMYLRQYVTEGMTGEKEKIIEAVRKSIDAVAKLEPGVHQDEVIRSYQAALRFTFLCCVVIAAVGVVVIAPINTPPLKDRVPRKARNGYVQGGGQVQSQHVQASTGQWQMSQEQPGQTQTGQWQGNSNLHGRDEPER